MSSPKKYRKRKNWTQEEDDKLMNLVKMYGTQNWKIVAKGVPNRDSKQCRERWINHLDPSVNKEPLTEEEWAILIREQKDRGNSWSEIASKLPGRTANQLKNLWHGRTRKEIEADILNNTHSSGTVPAQEGYILRPIPMNLKTEIGNSINVFSAIPRELNTSLVQISSTCNFSSSLRSSTDIRDDLSIQIIGLDKTPPIEMPKETMSNIPRIPEKLPPAAKSIGIRLPESKSNSLISSPVPTKEVMSIETITSVQTVPFDHEIILNENRDLSRKRKFDDIQQDDFEARKRSFPSTTQTSSDMLSPLTLLAIAAENLRDND